jgi:Sialic acid synthase
MRETPWGTMTYLQYRYKVEFDRVQYDEIAKYCAGKINFSASIWDIDSVDFMSNYDIPYIKIPSAHLTDDEMIHYICKRNIPVLLSTGMSSLAEVDHAVDIIKSYTDNYALLHANSTYPAHEQELNLMVIPKLRERYGCVVGYSGHEFGLVTTTVAVALGAKIIERHVTLNRTLWGTDQMVSVEPQGMLKLISQVRAVEVALGDGKKQVYDSELPVRKKLRGY